jgi:hypothetical protein
MIHLLARKRRPRPAPLPSVPPPSPRPDGPRQEAFEFVDEYRGPMARLVWGNREVQCTEWPGTFLAMLAAGVLGAEARGEAESITPPPPIVRPAPEPWTPPATACAVGGCGWPGEPCPYHPKAKRKATVPIGQERHEEEAWRASAPFEEPDRLISTETRRANVLVFLTARANHWVPGPEIADPAVGGSEGLRRVRELREPRYGGHVIEVRRMSGSDAYEYRLVV